MYCLMFSGGPLKGKYLSGIDKTLKIIHFTVDRMEASAFKTRVEAERIIKLLKENPMVSYSPLKVVQI